MEKATIRSQAKEVVITALQLQDGNWMVEERPDYEQMLKNGMSEEDATDLLSEHFRAFSDLISAQKDFLSYADRIVNTLASSRMYVLGEQGNWNSFGLLQSDATRIEILSGTFPLLVENAISVQMRVIKAMWPNPDQPGRKTMSRAQESHDKRELGQL